MKQVTEKELLEFGFIKNEHLILPSYSINISKYKDRFKILSFTLQIGNTYGYLREQDDDFPDDRSEDNIITIFNGDYNGMLTKGYVTTMYYLLTITKEERETS